MPQSVRTRRQKVVPYAANETRIEELGRGMIYRELYLNLQLTIDAATGNAITLANTEAGDEWAVVESIRIIANGSDVLRNFSGEQLRWLNKLHYGFNPRVPMITGVAADASLAINSTLVLPFWSIGTVRPLDTALDARKLQSLEIEVRWGDASSITGATNASFSADPTFTVFSLESFGVDGEFAQTRVNRIIKSSVGVQDQYEIDLPVGAMYRGLLINAKNATPADIDGALSNIKLRSGTTVFWDGQATMLRDVHMLREGTFITPDTAGTANDTVFASGDSDVNGWYFVDLITDGRLTEGIDTLGFAEMTLELNVASAIETLTVLPLQVIPVRKAANAA